MKVIITSSSILLLLIHILLELVLTLISSIDLIYLFVCSIGYFVVLTKEKKSSNKELYLTHYYSSLLFTLIHFLGFTLSYAEILPWEIMIVVVLFILIVFYLKSNCNVLLFESTDDEMKIKKRKCLLASICLYVYTMHLCLTTICTPKMYFNWFLWIKNCRFTYSSFQLSISFLLKNEKK